MKDKSVQREPPRLSIKATMAMRRRKPRAHSGPWKRGGIWSFIGLAGRGDAGCNAKLMVMSAVVVVVPVVNQPITGRENRAACEISIVGNEYYTPTILLGARENSMVAVLFSRDLRDPIGGSIDGCNGNIGSGAR
jgi:hypothetical protein